jgi:hypothetical protein
MTAIWGLYFMLSARSNAPGPWIPGRRHLARLLAFVWLLALALPTPVRAEEAVEPTTRTARVATDGAQTPAAASGAALDNQDWGPIQLVLYKSRRTLLAYKKGVFYKQYPVVLGFKPQGRKRFAHDARTPEGYYRIIDKRPHERWRYFLAIDYPNERDRLIYQSEVQAGLIPTENGRPFSIGSGLGIHGTDKPDKQAAGIDWTKGCIAMDNDDVQEIYDLVQVGTPIWLLE